MVDGSEPLDFVRGQKVLAVQSLRACPIWVPGTENDRAKQEGRAVQATFDRWQSGTVQATTSRKAARVLLIAEGPSVLLVGGRDPAEAGSHEFWVVPGGGMGAAESAQTAARRELWEETGAELGALGPIVWERHVEFTFAGKHYRQEEYFFVVHHERFDPAPAQLTTEEMSWVTTARWWPLDEIEATGAVVYPAALVKLAHQWLSQGAPLQPLWLGD